MAETIDTPAGSLETFPRAGDKRVLGWLLEGVQEGERVNQSDPAYPKIDEMMSYVLGEQLKQPRPSYLPGMVVNQTKKAIKTHASALTDIKPLFNYKTFNDKFKEQEALLNKRIVAWWINTFADLSVAEGIQYALTAGAGDILCEYDPNYMGGENRLIARDPRDTLPIRPSRSRSIQDWEGVIIREGISVNRLRATYPEASHLIQADTTGKWGGIFTRFRKVVQMMSPSSTLDGLKGGPGRSSSVIPEVILFRTYLNDRSLNLTGAPVIMGKPGTAWSYYVNPMQPLYPRKRLIVSTDRVVLYDGPNPYWHGMYPIARLRLDPWPWLFYGLSLAHDLTPMQDGINNTFNWMLSIFNQAADRGTIADANAIPESQFKRFDPRKPGFKVKVKATMGEGFKLVDPPTMPGWAMPFMELLLRKFEDLAGTANLQSLQQLGQMPSADTIQKYYDSLTPELKMEGRYLEAFIRDLAEMVKCNIFQYESKARRILLLGDAGKTLSDFDYDPDTLVPAMAVTDPRYIPELDLKHTRDERAKFFHKLFTFSVAPHSILALHAQEEKMMYLQLSRQGYMDFWTLMEMLEIPNVGSPPPLPWPVRDWTPQKDPITGMILPPPMEVRVPTTITERLLAQQQMGIGQVASPAGRKASGEEPPHMESKDGGTRTTVSESK
jgi:hypothetical protein